MKRNSFFFGIIVGAFFLILTLKGINIQETLIVLKRVNLIYVILGLFILLLGIAIKAYRLSLLLNNNIISFLTLFKIINIGYLVNNILPARMGELARIYLIGKKGGVGISKTIGVIILEKFFDVAILGFIFLSLVFNRTGLKNIVPFVGGILLPQTWQSRLSLFISSFKILKDRNKIVILGLTTLFIWILEGLWNYFLMMSLGINLPFSAAIFVACIVNFGLFIPSPPGYIGVFDFLATLSLLPFGIEKSIAFSFAILQHSLEYAVLSGLGVWSAYKISFNPLKPKWQNV